MYIDESSEFDKMLARVSGKEIVIKESASNWFALWLTGDLSDETKRHIKDEVSKIKTKAEAENTVEAIDDAIDSIKTKGDCFFE